MLISASSSSKIIEAIRLTVHFAIAVPFIFWYSFNQYDGYIEGEKQDSDFFFLGEGFSGDR
ncbi:MAG: hypothetical protein SWJ54_25465 [Cyanobacteriota bacterium]|nr:hypothetical protein [Cyanobacteriota bacterium]